VVRRPRGFTLVEMMVASVVAIILLSGAVGLLIAGARLHRRHVEQGRMKQSAALLLDQLTSEVRQAGLGRPSWTRDDGANERFPPAIFMATTTQIGFIADLPRPDSNFNGMSTLADDQNPAELPLNGLAVLNELNGTCDVPLGLPPSCTTDGSSLLFPPNPGKGCNLDDNAVTCPWALGRYRGGEYVLVVNGLGKWVERTLQATPYGTGLLRKGLVYTAPVIPATFFVGSGRGYVTTMDRVFYQFDNVNKKVLRDQCWNGPFPSTNLGLLGTPCAKGATTGTGWEPLIGHATLSFQYYDASNIALITSPATTVAAVDLPRIRRVEIKLNLSQNLPSTALPLTYDTLVSVSFRQ